MRRDDSGAMPIDDRLDDVALLLGVGFLWLKRRTGGPPPDGFPHETAP